MIFFNKKMEQLWRSRFFFVSLQYVRNNVIVSNYGIQRIGTSAPFAP